MIRTLPPAPGPTVPPAPTWPLALLAALVCLAALWSLAIGPGGVSLDGLARAMMADGAGHDRLILREVRLPRMLTGLVAGGALATAGAILQAITANPMAAPGLLGINAGAALAVVAGMSLFGLASGGALVWLAFAGGSLAAVLVLAASTLGGAREQPVLLVLAGAVLTAFLMSLTAALLIFDRTTLGNLRLWTAGSLVGRDMAQVTQVLPHVLAGLAAALALSRQLVLLGLGPEAARSLGQNPLLWRAIAVAIVTLLSGGAVALAGPVGFVGLVVPNVMRLWLGPDLRRLLPFCALGGAALVLLADCAGRMLFPDQSFPVGVTMALIGTPFFIALARGRAGGGR
ncbi:FecCD family ABC transporter permease [Marinibacterium sp. SX1]|uniref:FecCD family ABC transporter permease n=1 Tax=Marinibacterium sp. SX1 TaxID=3388424 RepID=UPI003D17AED3